MASENKVTLHGFWASPYVMRVELALKLKGIPYDYVEEDLMNKSPTLVSLNPVHKKVPVLVHNGRPICESVVILEYIDEMWPSHGPKILPEEPYARAQARFWAIFLQQLFESLFVLHKTEGDAQSQALIQLKAKLQTLEDHLDPSFTCIGKASVGFLDIVFWSFFEHHEVHEEALGIKAIDLESTPLVRSWLKALLDFPLVRDMGVPRDKLLGALHGIRQKALGSSPA